MCYQPLRRYATRVLKIVTMRVTPVVSVRGTDKPWRSCTGMVSASGISPWTQRGFAGSPLLEFRAEHCTASCLPFKFCWGSGVGGALVIGEASLFGNCGTQSKVESTHSGIGLIPSHAEVLSVVLSDHII